jgi:hypothetical protein
MGKLKALAQEVEDVIHGRASDGVELINDEADNSKEVLKTNITDCITALGKKYDLTIDDLNQLIYPNRDLIGQTTIEEKIEYYVDTHFDSNY